MAYVFDDPPLIKSLVVSAGWINGLLISASVIAIAIVLVKFVATKDPAKPGQFKIAGIDIPTGRSWIIFSGFTAGHLFVTYEFLRDLAQLFASSVDLRSNAWDALHNAPLLFFHGLVARLQYSDGPYGRVYFMDPLDPTSILAHSIAILVFLAIVRLKGASWMVRLGTTIAAVLVVSINWIIGTNWAVGASRLYLGVKSH